MMERLTYKQAYDKIIDAYFKDEILPMSMEFCFCGTLAVGVKCDNRGNNYWDDDRYSKKEYLSMEAALMKKLEAEPTKDGWRYGTHKPHLPDYEERLFAGMSAALDVLKQIHIERGEVIDEPEIKFTKRNLQPA